MSKRFLTRELIVSTAFQMVDEGGTAAFSVRGLAARLGAQVSSLYNHIDNEYELLLEAAKRAAVQYRETITKAVEGLPPEAAIYRGADSFRAFVNEHRYLYELLLDRRWMGDPAFEEVNGLFTRPIFDYLDQYNIKDKPSRQHVYVAVRVVTHGFGSLDSIGMFDGLTVDTTESYHMMIKTLIDMMKTMGKRDENDERKANA